MSKVNVDDSAAKAVSKSKSNGTDNSVVPQLQAQVEKSQPSLGNLLAQHKDILTLTPMNKIHCSVTKHDIPPNAEAVLAHLNSKAFRKAKLYSGDFSKFLPYVIPHRYSDAKLYCRLTKLTMNKIMVQVQRHVDGKKFKRLKKVFEEKQRKREARAKRKAERRARWEERMKQQAETNKSREDGNNDNPLPEFSDVDSSSSESDNENNDSDKGSADEFEGVPTFRSQQPSRTRKKKRNFAANTQSRKKVRESAPK